MRVKCLAQEHNEVSLARAPARTTRFGDECTIYEVTTPFTRFKWKPADEFLTTELPEAQKQIQYSYVDGVKVPRDTKKSTMTLDLEFGDKCRHTYKPNIPFAFKNYKTCCLPVRLNIVLSSKQF